VLFALFGSTDDVSNFYSVSIFVDGPASVQPLRGVAEQSGGSINFADRSLLTHSPVSGVNRLASRDRSVSTRVLGSIEDACSSSKSPKTPEGKREIEHPPRYQIWGEPQSCGSQHCGVRIAQCYKQTHPDNAGDEKGAKGDNERHLISDQAQGRLKTNPRDDRYAGC